MVPVVTLPGTRCETAGTPLVCLIARLNHQDTLKTRYFLVYLARMRVSRFLWTCEDDWRAYAGTLFGHYRLVPSEADPLCALCRARHSLVHMRLCMRASLYVACVLMPLLK